MTLPASYREQRACANCRHVFKRSDYDDGDDFYCTLNAPRRPMCGSVYMEEDFCAMNEHEYAKADKRWNEWASGRSVLASGTCDEHEART